MLSSMLARGEAARQRYLTQIDDATLTPRRRRLAARRLQALQRQLELIGHLETSQPLEPAIAGTDR
jgi:hypothetical protein